MHLAADDEHAAELARADEAARDGERVDEAAALRAQVEARDLAGTEQALQEERRAREVGLGRERGEDDAVDVAGLEVRGGQRAQRCLMREARRGFHPG